MYIEVAYCNVAATENLEIFVTFCTDIANTDINSINTHEGIKMCCYFLQRSHVAALMHLPDILMGYKY